jgi:hypothetical protein
VPNPNRPNDGETIAGEWGQLTADRVIRRYRSRADRDVDMAGVGDVTGQLVVIAPVGAVPWFEQHDGSGWRRVQGGPIIGGALQSPRGLHVIPPSDGSTWGQQVAWLSGGMEAFGSDSWDFVGDRRLLVCPLPGFYRIGGFLKGFNHDMVANWWYAQVARIFPTMDAAFLNNPANRLSVIDGGNPNMAWIWLVSDFGVLVRCNAGDGLTLVSRLDVPGTGHDDALFTVTYEGDFLPGQEPAPVPRPPGAGTEVEAEEGEEERFHGRCEYRPEIGDMGGPLDRPGQHD